LPDPKQDPESDPKQIIPDPQPWFIGLLLMEAGVVFVIQFP
jgi:hypothetical protein